MPPSAIVDADLSRDSTAYYVVEAEKIWKATGFGGGAAVWTELYSASSLPAADGQFLAIRCSPQNAGVLYALAVCTGGATYCGRSSTFGQAWSWALVASQTGKNYTADSRSAASTGSDYWRTAITTYTRRDDDGYNILGIAHISSNHSADLLAGADTINANSRSGLGVGVVSAYGNYSSGIAPPPAFTTALDDYFGSGGYTYYNVPYSQQCPTDPARVLIGTSSGEYTNHTQTSWVFWDKPSFPRALAVAPTNDAYVYIGTTDGIYKSIDGGMTFVSLTISYGANDLCVDWAAAGVVYYWASDGRLGYYVDTVENVLDLTETPDTGTRRLARYGGDLYVITAGNVKRRRLGAWGTLLTGLTSGQGMNLYQTTPQKIILVDASKVWYSADTGATWTDKTGGWTGFSSGVVAHLVT